MFDTKEQSVPAADSVASLEFLDQLEPGVLLAAALSGIEIDQVAGHDRVTVLRAHDRMAAFHQAQRSQAMASLVDAAEFDDYDSTETMEAAAAEARLALTLTRRAADSELAAAVDLRERLPRVWDAWRKGLIDARRVNEFLRGTAHLSVEEAADAADAILDAAPGMTTGQLAARLRRLCMKVDPEQATRRYEEALESRRLWMESTEAGTASLHAIDLEPDRVTAVMDCIHRHALTLRQAGDQRTIDQLRADVFLDLLEGTDQRGGAGNVELHVDLATLTELSETPGELAGFGPIVADLARQVAARADGTWAFTVTDADSRRPLVVGTTRRRPTTAQARAVRAQHPTCVFPGCRMSSSACDLDHRIPFSEGGPTTVENLTPLCRHDHRIRHLTGWGYEPRADGTFEWTTALGHSYISAVPP